MIMGKRALLIGSPFGGLAGVENDLDDMTELLSSRGFQTQRCFGDDATRDGIIHSFQNLERDVKTDEAVTVYYSGHGGLAEAAQVHDLTKDWQPWRYQFIVPMDYDKTTDIDFRGISSPELSRLIRDLTAKTRNVTLILDCCHAARMSRDLDLTPKALPRTQFLGVMAHLEQLRSNGLLEGPTYNEGNPNAVRVVAAATTESAYEYTNPQGRRIGILTEALGIALNAAENFPISWRTVMLRVQERVSAIVRQQHPTVEGPENRLLFSLNENVVSGVIGVGWQNGKPVLRGGRVVGLDNGDVFALMKYGAESVDPATQIAEGTAVRVGGSSAEVRLTPENAVIPKEGALAFPLRKALRRWSVKVEGDSQIADYLRSRIEESEFICQVGTKEDLYPPIAIVRVADGILELLDRSKQPLVKPRPADETAVTNMVANMETYARAQHLVALRSGSGSYALNSQISVELGRVEAGQKIPVEKSGETFLVGEKVYVTLRNEGNDTVYASVFDLGVTGKVTLLSQSSPSGLELPPDSQYTLGQDDYDGALTGYSLEWPETAPIELPRHEMLAVVQTSVPQDLRVLETQTMRATRTIEQPLAGKSELQRLLNQVSFGRTREIRPPSPVADVKFAIQRLGFLLDPSPLIMNDLPSDIEWTATDRGYIFDERLDRSLTRIQPRAVSNVPGSVAVRLAELIVHRNRALFGGANLRLDCMVITGAIGDSEPYRVSTTRFPSVRDNERLPFNNLLLFHGPVRDFLDIGIWISNDNSGNATFTQLLQEELNSTEFRTAAGILAHMTTLAPHGASTITAISAAAKLMNIGARLLSGTVNKSIGLYRTSLLEGEAFGVGRHPSKGLLRSKDFSFAYEIVAC